MSDCSAHRVPRARLDPITDSATALTLIRLAAADPPQPQTIVVTLDQRRCGLHLAVVNRTNADDDVIDVIERLLDGVEPLIDIDAMVVASVRPGDQGGHLDDADRWLHLDEIAESFGVELVEWFVLGRAVSCPRELIGDPERW